MQGELAEKERLAVLGQASSEFVHDLRSPLTVIYGYVQILSEELQQLGGADENQTRESLEYLQQIEKGVQRCQEMSEQWRDLGTDDPSRRKDVPVAELMEDVVGHAEALAAEAGARIESQPGPDGLVIHVDSLQIFRVLQNVVSNAVQALPESGGVVSIGWGRVDEAVEITVRDNGCGIEPDRLESVFNAYYTTKQGSGGMGIGLFIARKVVEAHGGTLTLGNNPDVGAVAAVRLPLHGNGPARPAGPESS
jgi:signal transduction histidine kinase